MGGKRTGVSRLRCAPANPEIAGALRGIALAREAPDGKSAYLRINCTPKELDAFVRCVAAKRVKVVHGAGLQADLRNIRPPRVFTVLYAWAHMNTGILMRILS